MNVENKGNDNNMKNSKQFQDYTRDDFDATR